MPEVDQSAPGCHELYVTHLEPLESLSLHCTAHGSLCRTEAKMLEEALREKHNGTSVQEDTEQTKSIRGACDLSHPARP